MLSYAEALETLAAAERFGIHPTLEGMEALAEALGRPQDSFDSIQVTGTNGKSSTTRMIAALLAAHGLKVGAYLSPELESMTERIQIDGVPVSEADFARAVEAVLSAPQPDAGEPGAGEPGAGEPDAREPGAREPGAREPGAGEPHTQFELLTAAALWLFREQGVDVACLEVGMGGRWDATSVVSPKVSVITGVGLDHMEHLGSTLEAIAGDKAHIIKPGSTAILGPGTVGLEPIFLERAWMMHAPVVVVRAEGSETPLSATATVLFELDTVPHDPRDQTSLTVRSSGLDYTGLSLRAPTYQAFNVATSVAAAEAYRGRPLDVLAVRGALASMVFPGRFEVLATEPALVIDGAHNSQAAAMLASAIDDAWPDEEQRPMVLLGILADKDAAGIVEALAPVASGIAVTQSRSPRALDAGALTAVVREVAGVSPAVYGSVEEALDDLRGKGRGDLVVTGSITTAAEARTWAGSHGPPR